MSKGSKRHSAKHNERLFKALFPPTPRPQPIATRPAHLDMTPEQIDSIFWQTGAADRTRMKKEAAKERQREEVRRVLAQESETP